MAPHQIKRFPPAPAGALPEPGTASPDPGESFALTVARIGAIAVMALVFSAERLDLLNVEGLAAKLRLRCGDVARQLGPLVDSGPHATQTPMPH